MKRKLTSSTNPSLNETTNDFEENKSTFRLPIKTSQNVTKLGRGRPKLSLPKQRSSERQKLSTTQSKENKNAEKTEDDIVFLKIEKSLSSESEKLCPSCKCIISRVSFHDHLTQCMQKFKFSKNDTDDCSEQSLPCPVCLMTIAHNNRASHIKSCGQSHGLTSEQTIEASRLQEKQAEERNSLGLPIVPLPPERKFSSSSLPKKNLRSGRKKTDPELELALALSTSIAEKDAEKRIDEENKLIQIGMADIVIEERRALPFLLPEPFQSKPLVSSSKRNKKQPLRLTALMTQSTQERDRIISEKVASLLTSSATFAPRSVDQKHSLSKALAKYKNEEQSLWTASSDDKKPSDDFFVPELQDFIQCRDVAIGGLLKNVSQIPGRLNYTKIMQDSDSEDDPDCISPDLKNLETTIIDNYCTQLALAELLDSQDVKNLTFSDGNNSVNNKMFECKNIEVSDDALWNPEVCSRSPVRQSPTVEDANQIAEIKEDGQTIENSDLELHHDSPIQKTPNKYHSTASSINNIESSKDLSKSPMSKNLNTNKLNPCCRNRAINPPKNASPEPNSDKIETNSLFSKLIYDWSVLLASGEMSDISLETAEGDIGLHSLVLRVRCLPLYDEAKKANGLICWKETSYEASFIFMVYLYTGQCSLQSKDNEEWMAVFDLALKYRCEKLVDYLEKICILPKSIDLGMSSCIGPQNEVTDIENITEARRNVDTRSQSPDIFEDCEETSVCSVISPILSPLSVASPVSGKDVSNIGLIDLTEDSGDSVTTEHLVSPKKQHNTSDRENLNEISLSPVATEQFISPAKEHISVPFDTSSTSSSYSKKVEDTSINNDIQPIMETSLIAQNDVDIINDVWAGFDDGVGEEMQPLTLSTDEAESPNSITANCTEEEEIVFESDNIPSKTIGDDTLLQAAFESEAIVTNQNKIKGFGHCKNTLELKDKSGGLTTPQNSSIKMRNNASDILTPLPNYKSMVTPELKKELERYGLRQMSRNKAIKLLLHIYDQLHPLLPDSEANETPKTSIVNKKKSGFGIGKVARKLNENDENTIKNINTKAKGIFNSSQSSTTSVDDDDSFECLEETVLGLHEEAEEEEDINLTATQQDDLNSRIRKYIYSDEALHRTMLLYEPIWLQDLHSSLKANGIKCSTKKLMTFLDEQCITFRFRSATQSRVRKRKRKSKSNSPRKRK